MFILFSADSSLNTKRQLQMSALRSMSTKWSYFVERKNLFHTEIKLWGRARAWWWVIKVCKVIDMCQFLLSIYQEGKKIEKFLTNANILHSNDSWIENKWSSLKCNIKWLWTNSAFWVILGTKNWSAFLRWLCTLNK